MNHEVGCRTHNTGCDGDCDCRSFAELNEALHARCVETVAKPSRPFVYRAELSADDICDLIEALDEVTSDKGSEYESENAPRLRALRDRLADIQGT